MSSDVWMMPQINPGSLWFHPCRLTSVNFNYLCVVCLQEEASEEAKLLPHKHDIISVLGVGGHWVTSHKDLQVSQRWKNKSSLTFNQQIFHQSLSVFVFPKLDPPDCRLLHLKSASLTFLNPEVWTASSSQQGRYLRILNSQCVISNKRTWSRTHTFSVLNCLFQIFWRTSWTRCQRESSGNSNTQWGCRVGHINTPLGNAYPVIPSSSTCWYVPDEYITLNKTSV